MQNNNLLIWAVLAITATTLILMPVASAAPIEKVLYNFGNEPDGNYPHSALVFDSLGNLFGTTVRGGTSGTNCLGNSCGTVFQLTPTNGQWTETVLYNFCQQSECTDGATPYGGLIVDAAGNLYGTTSEGGAYGYGVIFKLTRHSHGGWRLVVLHSFGNGSDGRQPLANLTMDTKGNLYGTTEGGGTSTNNCFGLCGTVFELIRTPKGRWNEKVLYNFCSQMNCTDGNSLTAGLVFDPGGHLYGTTGYGGDNGEGTVFELIRNKQGSWTERVLYSFMVGSDGYTPSGGVIVDTAGRLYGTTVFGGNGGNNGTVFELIRNKQGGWTERVIHSFQADGSLPYAPLVLDASGRLYGTTSSGGTSQQWGTVFELSLTKHGLWTDTTLYNFAGSPDGATPFSGLIVDAVGNLYGVTLNGGSNGYGTVFEVIPK